MNTLIKKFIEDLLAGTGAKVECTIHITVDFGKDRTPRDVDTTAKGEPKNA